MKQPYQSVCTRGTFLLLSYKRHLRAPWATASLNDQEPDARDDGIGVKWARHAQPALRIGHLRTLCRDLRDAHAVVYVQRVVGRAVCAKSDDKLLGFLRA